MGAQLSHEGNTPFSDDGLCDIDALKQILRDATVSRKYGDEEGDTEVVRKDKALGRYLREPENQHVREYLRGFVCEAPSEWDSTHLDTRYRKLLDAGEVYEGRQAAYDKFLALVKQYRVRDDF
jgi:hypothetical protein